MTRFFYAILIASLIVVGIPTNSRHVNASDCKDLKIIFARGSGEEQNTNKSYQAFKTSLEEKLKTTALSYDFVDLEYPAIAVTEDLFVALGAIFGGGSSYAFGDSVNMGINNLVSQINTSCEKTKFVLAGYSQGAIVVINSLNKLSSGKLIYAATFGDPKLYLPEGAGLFPAACRNQNLSNYRIYVPDCFAYSGLLGGTNPYQTESYIDKLGTWCNKMDIMCSSHFSISNHVSYVEDNLYEDAARIIFSKVAKFFDIKSNIASPHDTAILLDTTGSMGPMILKYKDETVRLATETLNAGGRVALFEYRDLDDPFKLVEHCNYESCTLEKFIKAIDNIEVTGGGDEPESLLSASLHVMRNLNWQRGATKSLVVLTDAGFLSPDRDGTTYRQVVEMSRKIDPVNFYIITEDYNEEKYLALAEDTDGKVVTNFDELSLLTDYIIERADSLPKVEVVETEFIKPTLEVHNVTRIADGSFKINLLSSTGKTLVILNDAVLGVTAENEFTITDIDTSRTNTLSLVPISDSGRGDAVIITLDQPLNEPEPELPILKAPNTGFKSEIML
ncbi:cutinase family protein [Candidatus Saccharibacteria bacterium]|nr:cutinase family protein [Candidatus Saccharibacteria bacterium]